ncbi:restriction endonuclease [bacterium]|nr:restriction endonuclease [bacterium]
MTLKIRKASGKVEDINEAKLMNSLVRSGASSEQASEITAKILSEIQQVTSTKKIYRLAHKYLKQFNHASELRYSLKKAIMKLGPSGYPFEKFIGEIFRQSGYDVQTGITLNGKCVTHEIDVIASKNQETALIECKYRNSTGSSPDVKVALYYQSRFQDLLAVLGPANPGVIYSGWLATNTRFSLDAIKYSECTGINLISWGYPESMSLEKMIEDRKLYPVTVLSNLTSAQSRKLIENDIILMKDLAGLSEKEISKMLSITARKAAVIRGQAGDLCFC